MPNNDILPNTNINLADWWEVPTSETIPAGHYAYSRGDSWEVIETMTDIPPHNRLRDLRYFTALRILPNLPSELGSRIYNVTRSRMNYCYEEGYRYTKNQWVLLRKGGYDVVTDSDLLSWTISPDE